MRALLISVAGIFTICHQCYALIVRFVGVVQAKDKQLVVLPDAWHILVKERGEAKILSQVITWLTSRC